ncbi:MAG: gamma-glutamyl-gamma-aminobutyrate hydrolase family protein, partial [Lentisphaerae bacterium]|nr:gamma-glutamyl-gamma-aminobutyrate hydrolase family protein [Lentisphaerota bacterium]
YCVCHHYVDRIVEYGALPLLIPTICDEAVLQKYVDQVDGFLFIGGEDLPPALYNEEPHPESQGHKRSRPEVDAFLMKQALKSHKPILGICTGAQLLNVVQGGKLIQHVENADKHVDEQYHDAIIPEGTLMRKLTGNREFVINSAHHQAVDPHNIGEGLRVSAYAWDGTIEAIERTDNAFWLGLQFHIERHQNKDFRDNVFQQFFQAVDRCAKPVY